MWRSRSCWRRSAAMDMIWSSMGSYCIISFPALGFSAAVSGGACEGFGHRGDKAFLFLGEGLLGARERVEVLPTLAEGELAAGPVQLLHVAPVVALHSGAEGDQLTPLPHLVDVG